MSSDVFLGAPCRDDAIIQVSPTRLETFQRPNRPDPDVESGDVKSNENINVEYAESYQQNYEKSGGRDDESSEEYDEES